METVIVIMEKDIKTGFLEKEVASLSISENVEYIVNLYSVGSELFIKLSDEKDLDDREFDAVYDYFDPLVFEGKVLEVKEVEDTYDPTWELRLSFDRGDISSLERTVAEILEIFDREIKDVYEAVKKNEGEYK